MSFNPNLSFDEDAAIDRLLRFLAVEGITGQEKAIARAVARELEAIGVPRRAIRHDNAHERIPVPTQTGNLLVNLPGTHPGPRLLFATHLDTVPLCAGVVPVRASKDRITSRGDTALGGDNRTGVACLVTLAETLLKNKLPHPPLTLLFTVREESGLFGARHLNPADLDGPVMGFNIDGRAPADLTVGAVGAERWEVEITGRAAHAGVHPEKGISATMVAALALAEVQRGGWFGKVHQSDGEGTSNIGRFAGRDGKSAGDATNVVTDYVHIHGESRSHDARFAKAITRAYRAAFANAAAQLLDDKGRKAKVKFTSRLDYHPFRLKEDTPVVRHAQAAAVRAGLQSSLRVGNGGLDANWFVRHGIPTVTFGAGQNNIHTIEEYVDLPLFLAGCRMALAIATLEK
ncbi:MAG TPA: M20/M25/M40 family metallo-hydrolase [Gemmataceae bacterium]|nr:M20/M25/M40 family metallo-hydrolase [Gemmataceae bacterium]